MCLWARALDIGVPPPDLSLNRLSLAVALLFGDFQAPQVACARAAPGVNLGKSALTIGISASASFTPREGSGRARIYAMRGFPEPHDERPVFIGVGDVWDRFHEIRRISARICEHPLQ